VVSVPLAAADVCACVMPPAASLLRVHVCIPPSESLCNAGFSGGGGGGGGARFHDPAEIFAQFFGTNNPFSAFGMGGGGSDDEGAEGMPGGMPGGFRMFMGGMPGMGGGGMPGMAGGGMPGMAGMGMPGMGPAAGAGAAAAGARRRGQPVQPEPIKRQLLCTLEELFSGTTKRIKVTRKRLNSDGKTTRPDEKVLEIVVKPGWKKGTTVTFEREGDEEPGVIPADLQFIIGEKEHDRFRRDGHNLVHTVKLPLAEALCGTTLDVRTLDGRTLSVPVTEVVAPGASKTVRGEGMPVSKTPGTRGDLVIRFEVAFPRSLSEDKKRQLRALLA